MNKSLIKFIAQQGGKLFLITIGILLLHGFNIDLLPSAISSLAYDYREFRFLYILTYLPEWAYPLLTIFQVWWIYKYIIKQIVK